MEGTIGTVIIFAGNFAPRNWMFCQGQLLPISNYQSLFSILGTTYGGDGRTTFALPDLRGRAPLGQGQGYGLSNRPLGHRGGEERHLLNFTEMPAHYHSLTSSDVNLNVSIGVNNDEGETANPSGATIGMNANDVFNEEDPTGNLGGVNSSISGNTTIEGGSASHNNMQPWISMNYVICIYGTYPSRN
jgi:microcystin-dependent protein